jgi:hypothetical protein
MVLPLDPCCSLVGVYHNVVRQEYRSSERRHGSVPCLVLVVKALALRVFSFERGRHNVFSRTTGASVPCVLRLSNQLVKRDLFHQDALFFLFECHHTLTALREGFDRLQSSLRPSAKR